MNNTETNEPATNHLSAADIRAMLRHLDTIKAFTMAMRKQVRVPTTGEVYGSDYAVDALREMILAAAISDVEVEVEERAA